MEELARPSTGMVDRARPAIRAPSATPTIMPAVVKPNRNGATMTARPPASSSAAWVGREMRRRAVISTPILVDWPVNVCDWGHTGPVSSGAAGSVPGGGLAHEPPELLALLLAQVRRPSARLAGDSCQLLLLVAAEVLPAPAALLHDAQGDREDHLPGQPASAGDEG